MSNGSDSIRITRDRVLLVEGTDEVNLVSALMNHHFGAAAASVQLVPGGGRTRFRERLSAIKTAGERVSLRALGVVRDADGNARAAWNSVHGAVDHVGLPAPRGHADLADGFPAVGIFIVPDGQAQGALETRCVRSVAETPGGRCVERYLACLRDGDALVSRNRDKSFAHAWLASRRDPMARVGEAAQQGEWNFDHPAFAPLVQFVERLMNANP